MFTWLLMTTPMLVQCVKDIYEHSEKFPNVQEVRWNLDGGKGIGVDMIKFAEPSLSEVHIKAALKTFLNTSLYPKLLKQGGLPEAETGK